MKRKVVITLCPRVFRIHCPSVVAGNAVVLWLRYTSRPAYVSGYESVEAQEAQGRGRDFGPGP